MGVWTRCPQHLALLVGPGVCPECWVGAGRAAKDLPPAGTPPTHPLMAHWCRCAHHEDQHPGGGPCVHGCCQGFLTTLAAYV